MNSLIYLGMQDYDPAKRTVLNFCISSVKSTLNYY